MTGVRLPRLTAPVALAYGTTVTAVSLVSFVAPVLPELSEYYGVSVDAVAMLQVAVVLPGVVTGVVLMRLTKRFRLELVLSGMLFVYGAAGLTIFLHGSFALALLARFAQGIGGGALLAASFAILSRLPPGSREGPISLNAALISFMMIVSPLGGSLLAQFSPRAPFAIYGLALCLTVPAYRTHLGVSPSAPSMDGGGAVSRFIVLGLALVVNAIIFGWSLLISPLFLADVHNLHVGGRGLVLGLQSAAALVAALAAKRVLEAGGSRILLRVSFIVAGVGLVGASVAPGIGFAVLMFAVAGSSYGFANPAILSLVASVQSDSAAGWWQSATRCGQMLGPLVAAGLWGSASPRSVVAFGALVAALGLVLVTFLDADAGDVRDGGPANERV